MPGLWTRARLRRLFLDRYTRREKSVLSVFETSSSSSNKRNSIYIADVRSFRRVTFLKDERCCDCCSTAQAYGCSVYIIKLGLQR